MSIPCFVEDIDAMQKKPTIRQLMHIVVPKIAEIWNHVAIQLGISPDEVGKIKRNRQDTSAKDCFIQMFRTWLDKNDASDSAKADELIKAVKMIGNLADAREFETG